MIVLLCADRDDARGWWERAGHPDVPVVVVTKLEDFTGETVTPGARIIVTDRCTPRQGIISALQALHARIGLVDPTGLLGPINRREGARSVEPDRTPPTGTALATERAKLRRAGFKNDLGSAR